MSLSGRIISFCFLAIKFKWYCSETEQSGTYIINVNQNTKLQKDMGAIILYTKEYMLPPRHSHTSEA